MLLFLCKVELSCTLVTTEIASNITGVIVALFVMYVLMDFPSLGQKVSDFTSIC